MNDTKNYFYLFFYISDKNFIHFKFTQFFLPTPKKEEVLFFPSECLRIWGSSTSFRQE